MTDLKADIERIAFFKGRIAQRQHDMPKDYQRWACRECNELLRSDAPCYCEVHADCVKPYRCTLGEDEPKWVLVEE